MSKLSPIGRPQTGHGEKKAWREGRPLVFIDETGFMLQPTVRRTWAPRGDTPVHHSWDRQERLSVTGAITVSPLRKRLGCSFSIRPANRTGVDLFACVQQRRGHLKRPLLIIWDRFSGQKKAARLLHDLYGKQLHGEEFPADAPDLNMVDHAWGHTKYGAMANCIPQDLDDLAAEVAMSMLRKHQRPNLLRAFFKHARLDL